MLPPNRIKPQNNKVKKPTNKTKYIYDKPHVYEQVIQNDRNIDTLRSLLERTNISAKDLEGEYHWSTTFY